ncbi:hypothetical protein GFH48_34100 [Streptomyces fagopyri]|uniref:Uncharacterized protein n=1 Tax=Streptomyces fagopyri TaxID=2662397 RepID=A0A5Q0LMC5_9ACTN|nr:hypothetical protein GFH48_34100 [Streptomyces fagopyri]
MTRSPQAVACVRPCVVESVPGGGRPGFETSRGATPTGSKDHQRFLTGCLTAHQAGARTDATPSRGLGDLPAVAAESAERSGARGDLVHLAQTAGRRGSSKVVTQARRLRTALAPWPDA